jgi:HK97 gp10 family phage protein
MRADNFQIRMQDVETLVKRFKELRKDAKVRQAIRAGLRAGAKLMATDAKQNAPIFQGKYPASRQAKRKPGTLRRFIRVRSMKRSRVRFGMMIASYYTGDAYYGSFLEYGTKNIKPRPFLRPAFDKYKHDTIALVQQKCKDFAEKEFLGK